MWITRTVFDEIYFDFQRVFYTVPHQRLLAKLRGHSIGDELINRIRNWVLDRRQRVVINGE